MSRLERINYYHNGNQGIDYCDAFKRNGNLSNEVLDVIMHNLYVCFFDSKSLERHILFREFLRTNDRTRIEYQNMKYKLAKKAGQDKKIYAELKKLNVNDFIDKMIEKKERTHKSVINKNKCFQTVNFK